ncbi:MAG: S8 family serine peptidase [Muribaculaceae bacterium]|nr:S8 family serine peptidase [Muribaculaceae bacterium]
MILTLAAGVVAMGASAQSKLDAGSRARLRSEKTPVEFVKDGKNVTARARARKAASAEEATIRGFITVSDAEKGATALANAGASITGGRGTILLAEFPESALAEIEALEEVKAIRTERVVAAKLDKAREVSGINKIHSGLDLPQSYTGKGVICGIVDGGFDPNHINFLDENGVPRIGQFTYFRPTQSGNYIQETHDRDYIPRIDTESSETYHATHTTGIMAGGYRGKVQAAVAKNAFAGTVQEMDNPYYGVAYEADIAAAAGSMSDYHIALGVEDILNYAWAEQKPSVVNLSLGSNVGPHDGTSTICRYLDLVSEEDRVVFCVSAGNEGDLPIALNKTFTADDATLKTCIFPATYMTNYPNLRYTQIYIYSKDETPFEVQVLAVNKNRNGNVAWRGTLNTTEDGSYTGKYWVSGAEYMSAEDDIVDPQFAKWFKGYVGVVSERDADSQRSYAVIDCFCWDNSTGNASGNYIIGFQITGADGQRVDVFCDGAYNNLSSYGFDGFSNGMTDGTISDVACGHNYVVVGSYNTRDDWASLDEGIYGYQNSFPSGKISSFSSYGKLCDGREMPTVCAPGATIISSSNEYFLDEARATNAERQAMVEANGRKYSWHQSVGTSMSTPLVAGSIALWMEADPNLKYNDVLDIIKKTAVRDEAVEEHSVPVQWGAGKFDAYAGLKEVLRRAAAGIGNVSAEGDGERLTVASAGDRQFKATLNGTDDFNASLYTASGQLAGSYRSHGGEALIDAGSMPAGVYLLKAEGSAAKAVRILVK